jgi:hypothetical protein
LRQAGGFLVRAVLQELDQVDQAGGGIGHGFLARRALTLDMT